MSSRRSEPPPTRIRGATSGLGASGKSRATTCSPSRLPTPVSNISRARRAASSSRSTRARCGGMRMPNASNSSRLQPAPRPARMRWPPNSTAIWANWRNTSAGCRKPTFETIVPTRRRSDSAAIVVSVVIGSCGRRPCARWSRTRHEQVIARQNAGDAQVLEDGNTFAQLRQRSVALGDVDVQHTLNLPPGRAYGVGVPPPGGAPPGPPWPPPPPPGPED